MKLLELKTQIINHTKKAVGSIYWIGAVMSLTLIILIPEEQYEDPKTYLAIMGIMIVAITSFFVSELLAFIVRE